MLVCPCENDVFQELDNFIDTQEHKADTLLVVLHKAQVLFGFIPQKVQQHIARRLNIPVAKVYGVVTFYSYFQMEPKGKFGISVCTGTACFVRGAQEVLKEFEKVLGIDHGKTTEDQMFSLHSLRCVGACGLAPVVMVNDRVYGRVAVKDVKRIVEECRLGGRNSA